MNENLTCIQVSKANRKRLLVLGRKGESYNDVLGRLLDEKEAGQGA